MTRLLDEHVQVLTRDHLRRTVGAEGPVYGQEPALLVLLREAIASDMGRGSVAGVAGTGAPLDLTALSIWQGIETTVDAWWREHCATSGAVRVPVVNKLRAVSANVTDAAQVVYVAEQCGAWIERIRERFEPQVKLTLQGACPECEQTHVMEDAEDGQVVYNASLVAYQAHALCRACGYEWHGPQMHMLAARIGVAA